MSNTALMPPQMQTPERRNWTEEEFDRLADLGFFGPEERLELICGDLVKRNSFSPPEATALILSCQALLAVFGLGFDVRSQMPLAVDDYNRPDPDISVVKGVPRDYAKSHPTTAILVLEISDTTLLFDQTQKQGIYARAGIPEYWIVNLRDRLLEVYRQPVPIAGYPLGHGYQQVLRLTDNDTIAPLAIESATIAVADLLP